jgi:hypothetical protein
MNTPAQTNQRRSSVQRLWIQAITCCFICLCTAPAVFADSSKAPDAKTTDAKTTDAQAVRAKPPSSRVDVQTEIWPILQSRCLGCHGPMRADGELRLDEKKFIDDGGHTGNMILGTVEDSELLRRLNSRSEDYRMPKNHEPLSPDEVQLITRWIAQGANWPAGAVIVLPAEKTPPPVDFAERFSVLLDFLLQLRSQIGFLGIPSIAILMLILWIERRKRHLISTTSSDSWTRLDGWVPSIGTSHYASATLMMLMVATSSLLYRSHQANEQLRQDIQVIRSNGIESQLANALNAPKVHRPKHPPRMSGEYYRGNDERSEKLFNGGFYRTATFRISLKDKSGDVLEWNDEVPAGQLFVDFEVEKAPFATKELFEDFGLKNASLGLQDASDGTQVVPAAIVNLEVIESGQRWGARYPIFEVTEKSTGSYSGEIHLKTAGTPHYGIKYEIDLKEGLVAESSELWMGAVYLTGNVRVLPELSIALDEWFDFRPIPEIEKGNTDDPVLLGIPEHVKSIPTE